MAQWGNRDVQEDAPVFTADATTGKSGTELYGTEVFGQKSDTKNPGWVRIVEGTGSRAGRTTTEILVAMKNIADAAPADTPPSNTAIPTISGTPGDGEVLTASDGTWDGSPAPTFTYQWQSSATGTGAGIDISGATSGTYTVDPSYVGEYIRVVVTATNSEGTDEAESAYVGPIA